MSDNRAAIYCNFINRRTGAEISVVPFVNRLTLNKDITQLTDTFDFEIQFKFSEKIDLHSHDFVEFYFLLDKKRFQIGCGFMEDFVRETTPDGLRFQANGRDFLGQLFNLPFLNAKFIDTTTIQNFCKNIINQTYVNNGSTAGIYLKEYLDFKKIERKVVDAGAFAGAANIPELSDTKIAPVLQSIADEIVNIVYQNRFGQLVIWGRDSKNELDTGLWLTDVQDSNGLKFSLRENFSKVYSEVKIQIASGEGNLDYVATPSAAVFNSLPKARQIFQPEVRTFQTPSLVTTAPSGLGPDAKRNMLAGSLLRKSNQNLTKVVIKTSQPFYVTATGQKVPYEVNQLWNIKSEKHDVAEKMRLHAISYNQTASELSLELGFIPLDSLV